MEDGQVPTTNPNQQPSVPIPPKLISKKILLTLLIFLTFTLLLAGGYSIYKTYISPGDDNTDEDMTDENNEDQTPDDVEVDETDNWQTFISETEGFTLKYPQEWTIENSSDTNCAHEEIDGSDCRDRYDFVAPDGIRVRYVIHNDENNDTTSCGLQSECITQNVISLEDVDIPNFGTVSLVKLDSNEIFLHQPLNQETTPIVGENKHDYFWIDFSLESKTGGRYKLFVTTSFAGETPENLKDITSDEFYSLESVNDAVLILKSLEY